MKRLSLTVLVLLVMGVGVAPWAQAQDGLRVPQQQRRLTNILSKYNGLEGDAPNDIQRRKIGPEFYKAFCSAIPKGEVTGWIGDVDSIDDDNPSHGIQLIISVQTQDLYPGSFGVELSLGNDYAYGVDATNTQPHGPTLITVGSRLYSAVSKLSIGDTIRFSGTFIPYTSPQACYANDTTYFALFRFSKIQKIGRGVSF